jgi:hypothetical protein
VIEVQRHKTTMPGKPAKVKQGLDADGPGGRTAKFVSTISGSQHWMMRTAPHRWCSYLFWASFASDSSSWSAVVQRFSASWGKTLDQIRFVLRDRM